LTHGLSVGTTSKKHGHSSHQTKVTLNMYMLENLKLNLNMYMLENLKLNLEVHDQRLYRK